MYQVLYRKWRPRAFRDVAGQEHITSTLANEIESGKVSHAYLFTGSRGTGKTTCAKIFAKAVNCLNPVNGNPCNECAVCKGIDDGSILDVIELDAASNNGVDNIRDIIDESNFTPVNAKYRVYIIDEVHMLSTGAFNALLKTLEEPPAHVKFILATTEVHKIPSTILSRCQRFDFKRITPEAIAKRVQYVAEQEGIEIEPDAAFLIARVADGALRDALSLLDRCSGAGGKIGADDVSAAAGLAGRERLFSLIDAINQKDTSQALSIVNDLHNDSCDMERLCSDMLNHFRNLLIVKTVKNPYELIICVDEDMKRYKEQTEKFKLETILNSLSVIEKALVSLKNSINKRIETEMTVVRLCNPSVSAVASSDNSDIIARIEKIEEQLKNGVAIKSAEPAPAKKAAEAPAQQSVKEEPKATEEMAPPPPPQEPLNRTAPSGDVPLGSWGDVIASLSKSDVPLMGILKGSSAFIRGEHLLIKCDNPTFPQFIKIPLHASALREAVTKVTGQRYRLGIYRSNDAGAVKKDPLADLIKKINN
ncbi:MAG: DNA polymerase III subunit gamma/tau [Clostridia bacterium]|nr:DNA polymerase III subunit gamma/tau [Clostridia bacterium]